MLEEGREQVTIIVWLEQINSCAVKPVYNGRRYLLYNSQGLYVPKRPLVYFSTCASKSPFYNSHFCGPKGDCYKVPLLVAKVCKRKMWTVLAKWWFGLLVAWSIVSFSMYSPGNFFVCRGPIFVVLLGLMYWRRDWEKESKCAEILKNTWRKGDFYFERRERCGECVTGEGMCRERKVREYVQRQVGECVESV